MKDYDTLLEEMIQLSLKAPQGAHKRVADNVVKLNGEKGIEIGYSWRIRAKKDAKEGTENNVLVITQMRDMYKEEVNQEIKRLTQ